MAKNSKNLYLDLDFDFSELLGYQGMVDAISHCDEFEELELGDPSTLVWDYDFLMTVLRSMVDNHSYQLEQINGFSYFWLAFDYINEVTVYSLVNDRQVVGQQEMLNTFKFWDYVPFDLKLDILDDLFIQENIDYRQHPFQLSGPRNKPKFQKIIPFRIPQKKTE